MTCTRGDLYQGTCTKVTCTKVTCTRVTCTRGVVRLPGVTFQMNPAFYIIFSLTLHFLYYSYTTFPHEELPQCLMTFLELLLYLMMIFLFLNRAWFLDVILDDLHNTRHEGAMFKIWLKSVEFKCIKNSLKD